MTDQPTDPKLITAELISELLREMSRLEDEYEQAKHALVGGEYPVSEDRMDAWLKESALTEEEAEENPAYMRYDRISGEYHCTTNYLQCIIPFCFQQQALEQVAEKFPSLRGVEGVKRMETTMLHDWIEHEACPQGVHAGRFILSLWTYKPDSFNVTEAFAVWDEEHQDAYVQWLKRPVVLQERLWGII
jgi:hypothetical protein